MSKQKNRTPCFVVGCLAVAVVFIVAIVMLAVLFLHIPAAPDFYKRVQGQTKLHSVYLPADDLDVSQLSEFSRNMYQSLQSEYISRHEGVEDGFACTGIVEYVSDDVAADEEGYVYGMLIYTDSITMAYDVFTTYYSAAGEQGVDFSETDFFLFVRGKAVFVGNQSAFTKAYMNNMF